MRWSEKSQSAALRIGSPALDSVHPVTVRTLRAGRRFGNRPGPGAADDVPAHATFAAVGLVVCAALARAAAALLPVVRTVDGAPATAGFTGWPLLVALAVLPAVVLLGPARRAPAVAAGLVLGLAALAP